MSPAFLVAVFFLIAFFILYVILCSPNPKNKKQRLFLPPGPRPLPIIGSLHLLGTLPHQSLYRLAKQHGSIMFLKLGFVETVVVSSAQAAELFLKSNDLVFANRPRMMVSDYLSYGSKGMIFDDYGPYWRDVKKVCSLQLLSSSKIESFAALRKEEVELMVHNLKKASETGQKVNVGATVGDVSENLICRMIFGQRITQQFELRPLIKEALDLVGAINVADYVNYVGPLDLQGLTKRMKTYRKRMDRVLEKIIDNHEKDDQWKIKEDKDRDFIDVLLSLMNNKSSQTDDSSSYVINRTCIKAIIQDIIIGGFETSASSIEWTFSELIRNPRIMTCLQQELESVVGFDRIVEESDLRQLTYLDMVIKESLRLHPTLPFIPRKNLEDITVNGYHIPNNTRVLINLWAIGRDCNAWKENTMDFYPERFKDQSVDFRGRNFELIPFGAGRRSCPGLNLGLRNVKLIVAQLVHCFNWDMPDGMLPRDLDMTEKYGLTMPRANPLFAIPKYRSHV